MSEKPKQNADGKDFISHVFEEVPEIGSTWRRWYDIPYRVLWWMIRQKKYTPRIIRFWALDRVNELLQYCELDRLKVWDKKDGMRNVFIPKGEKVITPSVIVVELYTPNEAIRLQNAIKKNGWDVRRTQDETNTEKLAIARSKNNLSWWNLADIVSKDFKGGLPDAIRKDLPTGVRAVKLKAMQIGSGLTAVVARFSFDDKYSQIIDETWRANHEPLMEKKNGRKVALSRKSVNYKATQSARNSLHQISREWMSKFAPGYFATHGEDQLSLDVMMFNKYNPTSKSKNRPSPDTADAYRSLGLDISDIYRIIAPEMPDMLLQRANRYSSNINVERTWSISVNENSLKKSTNNFAHYGSDSHWATTHIVEERVGSTLVLLAVSELLSILESQYSLLRDGAKHQHSRFKVRNLNKLSDITLDAGLTLASVKQDIKNFSTTKWWFDGATFKVSVAPIYKEKLKEEATVFFDNLIGRQQETLQRLIEVDKDYRGILESTASLKSVSNTIKLARTALFVSIVSVIIAIVTVRVSGDTSDDKVNIDSLTRTEVSDEKN